MSAFVSEEGFWVERHFDDRDRFIWVPERIWVPAPKAARGALVKRPFKRPERASGQASRPGKQ
jgi:hypothetical protein